MRTRLRWIRILVALIALNGAVVAEEDGLVGRHCGTWGPLEWIQGGPLHMEELRGRVVLVRWWTGSGCPYCESSAADLAGWNDRYGSSGLVVVGLYHHKSGGNPSREEVSRLARRLGFTFPVAIDIDWRTLRSWWLDGHERDFTSVSMLIDTKGIIRFVHPGGAYSREDAAVIGGMIRTLLP